VVGTSRSSSKSFIGMGCRLANSERERFDEFIYMQKRDLLKILSDEHDALLSYSFLIIDK
jgi:hypothetical protein